MKTKKKPRSRTVRLGNGKMRVKRHGDEVSSQIFYGAGAGQPGMRREFTDAELRKIAKAYLEMAGDD